MNIHVLVYLLHEYMHGSRNFARMVGGPSPTDRKKPWQHFSPQLILQCKPNGYFKGTIIFEESRRGWGVTNFRGSNLFQGDGAKLHFSIETYKTRCSPGGSRLPAPFWIRALPMCTCPCLWHFKVTKTKHAASSSKA